ncbi:MAG: endonuclease III [Nanoarchaeota archaeon]|nr:endonuclease III [Nanoarchaeota archaeon]
MNSKKHITQLNQLKCLGKKPKDLRLAAESWNSSFKILIATILSARTRDETTIPVAEKLFQKYPNAKSLSKAPLSAIQKIIRPVNFYRNKSKNISNCAKAIVKNYNSKVPEDLEELIKLPGVGRKTANVFLSEIGHDSIGVDTHVSYVSKKIGWTKNKNLQKIEEDLKKLFPKRYWAKLNPTLVRFGKTYTSRREKDDLINKIKKIM